MTVIEGSGTTQRAREEGAALQRRLIQDLERQWLESWGEADAALRQTAPISEQLTQPPSECASGGNTTQVQASLSAGSSIGVALQGGTVVRRDSPGSPKEVLATARGPWWERANGNPSTGQETSLSAPPSAVRGLPEGRAVPSGGANSLDKDRPASREPQTSWVAQPASEKSDRIAASGLAACAGTPCAPAGVDGLAGRPQARAEGADLGPVGPALGAASLARDGGLRSVGEHTLSLTVNAQGVAAPGTQPDRQHATWPHDTQVNWASVERPSASIQLTGTALPDLQDSRPTGAVQEGDEAHARTGKGPSFPRSLSAEPSDRHLMLRELSDQAVLGSMRDSQLSSEQSLEAAQRLSRALMDAGYARVQVVVNGHEQIRTAHLHKDSSSQEAAQRAKPATPSPSNSHLERNHGHQH